MKKQASAITITKRGNAYYADVTGAFGGGYHGAHAGKTPEEAALFALREKARYIDRNPEGGDIFAPQEVRDAMESVKVDTRQIILRRCPADLHNWLRHEAVDRGLTMEKLIIELLQKSKK